MSLERTTEGLEAFYHMCKSDLLSQHTGTTHQLRSGTIDRAVTKPGGYTPILSHVHFDEPILPHVCMSPSHSLREASHLTLYGYPTCNLHDCLPSAPCCARFIQSHSDTARSVVFQLWQMVPAMNTEGVEVSSSG